MINVLKSMSPDRVVREALQLRDLGDLLEIAGRAWPINDAGIWILGSGKAAFPMARAAVEVLGDRVHGGLIITPGASEEKDDSGVGDPLGPVHVRYAAHPLPEERNMRATRELLELCQQIPEGALVIYLLSGGSSSLLCAPLDGIVVGELRQVHQALLRSGATIHEMNLVRRALSQVKGGQLLPRLSHTRLIDLVISDVPGDELSVIGSGPTTQSPIETGEAIRLLKQRGLWDALGSSVRNALESSLREHGESWQVSSTPVEHQQEVVASAARLARMVAESFQDRGGEKVKGMAEIRGWGQGPIEVSVVSEAYREPIGDVASRMAREIVEAACGQTGSARPTLLLWFGECTVQVTGSGKGGRNQELALRVALDVERLKNESIERRSGAERNLAPWTLVSLATDGVDGPTDSAGGVVHEGTLELASERGVDLEATLRDNDAWNALEALEAHIRTGPTGHNLMDLQAAWIGVPQVQEID